MSLNTGDLDVQETRLGDCSMDLGGFGQYVHRGDLKRKVEWGIDLAIGSGTQDSDDILAPFKTVSMKVSFGMQGVPLEHGVKRPRMVDVLGVERFTVSLGHEALLEMGVAGVNKRPLDLERWQGLGAIADRGFPRQRELCSAQMDCWVEEVNFKHPVIQRWLSSFWQKYSDTKLSPRSLKIVGKTGRKSTIGARSTKIFCLVAWMTSDS